MIEKCILLFPFIYVRVNFFQKNNLLPHMIHQLRSPETPWATTSTLNMTHNGVAGERDSSRIRERGIGIAARPTGRDL
jgi:hypothetical protein